MTEPNLSPFTRWLGRLRPYGRALLRRLRPHSKENTTFVSFAGPLEQVCRLFAPQTALEFGPGYSTRILLAHSPAQIVSLESNPEWFHEYQNAFPPERVQVVYQPVENSLDALRPPNDGYDLIFVDGGDRLVALQFAYDSLAPKGVVYLHDAHREDYEPGIELFPYRFFPERHSCLLFKDQDTYEQARAGVSRDYSCRCQYCSSAERRAYFSRMAGPVV